MLGAPDGCPDNCLIGIFGVPGGTSHCEVIFTRLEEQVLALGRQHALLDNRHRAVEGEHNELLRHVTSLEKGLATAEKRRDEAVAALEESQKREKDMRSSNAEKEKLFEEQLFSIAKALSDTTGLSWWNPSLEVFTWNLGTPSGLLAPPWHSRWCKPMAWSWIPPRSPRRSLSTPEARR